MLWPGDPFNDDNQKLLDAVRPEANPLRISLSAAPWRRAHRREIVKVDTRPLHNPGGPAQTIACRDELCHLRSPHDCQEKREGGASAGSRAIRVIGMGGRRERKRRGAKNELLDSACEGLGAPGERCPIAPRLLHTRQSLSPTAALLQPARPRADALVHAGDPNARTEVRGWQWLWKMLLAAFAPTDPPSVKLPRSLKKDPLPSMRRSSSC